MHPEHHAYVATMLRTLGTVLQPVMGGVSWALTPIKSGPKPIVAPKSELPLSGSSLTAPLILSSNGSLMALQVKSTDVSHCAFLNLNFKFSWSGDPTHQFTLFRSYCLKCFPVCLPVATGIPLKILRPSGLFILHLLRQFTRFIGLLG